MLADQASVHAVLQREIYEALTELSSDENGNALVAELEEEMGNGESV